jgi:Transglutaminase-like superfamily
MIGGFRTFVRLSRADRRAVIEAATVCAVTKLLLATMPYRIVDSLTAEISRGAGDRSLESNREEIDRLIRAVNAAGRFIPGAKNCLVRAISAKVILGRRGYSTNLRFGVKKQKGGTIGAHAWLEGGGRVVIGGLRPDFMCRWFDRGKGAESAPGKVIIHERNYGLSDFNSWAGNCC